MAVLKNMSGFALLLWNTDINGWVLFLYSYIQTAL